MQKTAKYLFAVLLLIVLLGSSVAFISLGNNAGVTPTPIPEPTSAMASSTPLPTAMASTAPASATGSGSMATSGTEKKFEVKGGSFFYSPNILNVKKGDTVSITMTNTGGFHDINVDEFNAHSKKTQTGDTATITFVADKVGSFEYYCSVGNHRANGQRGTLVVQ